MQQRRKENGLPCANLRFYSIYGPLEDPSRLIPRVVVAGLAGRLPPLADPETSRDFVYVDDACAALIAGALELRETHYGEAFNVGTGEKTSIRQVAALSKRVFSIDDEPDYSHLGRAWDLPDWYADPGLGSSGVERTSRPRRRPSPDRRLVREPRRSKVLFALVEG